MDIVLFGIQGSGKGTIARAVSGKFGFEYFETGAQLRKLSGENSDLGRKVKEIIEAGKLVPNEIVMEIIEDFMGKISGKNPIIFDGIPRKMIQAETFDTLMKNHNRKFTGVLLEVPKDIALKRLTRRRICSKCKTVYPAGYSKETCEKCGGKLITRNDDTPDSIKTRFKAYFKETIPVINKYKEENKLLTIDGIPKIPEVRDAMIELVHEKLL